MSQAPSLPVSLDLPTEQATSRFAAALAPHLGAGDVLCLHGAIGAGKSVLARAIIRTRLNEVGRDEDIPSPTYTLVQTYHAGALEIWHSDLYRLGEPRDVAELGLDEAFETALCLIEWPDRLGGAVPAGALHLTLQAGAAAEARHFRLASDGPDWSARLASVLAAWQADPARGAYCDA